MIDWDLVRRIAEAIGGQAGSADAPPGDIAAIAADAQTRVLAYSRLTPFAPLPEPEMVSRQQWIESNIRSMRPVLDRVGARVGGGMGVLGRPTRAITRALFSAQVGGLTGFLAQRVLGQYDMPLLDTSGPARLLLVAPNLGGAAERLEVDSAQLLQWVTLHEMTHAAQFGSVPWLRLHLASLVREVVDTLEVKVDASKGFRLPSGDDLRGWIESIRHGELVTLVIGRERRVLVDRIQATMAVVEGHAEHVMDAVGAEVIPTQAELRAALERRRMARSGPMRLLERVLGFELKLRQYRDGKRFCDAVVEQIGIEGLNRVWSGPHALPTLAELTDPQAWIARTTVPFVTK
ncbi:MAG TPA: zinc-dependent metalloprotease [Solirubrobacteraceae bacterium]|nr:zinc-dependent metalloprotease [Solirubrobacteraceae bacterium]